MTNGHTHDDGHAHDDSHDRADEQAAAVARLEEAIFDLTRAIERDPDDADAYSRRGVAYGQMAAPMEALRDFNHVVRLRPESAEAYYNRGMAHTSLHQPLQAIDDYTSAWSWTRRTGTPTTTGRRRTSSCDGRTRRCRTSSGRWPSTLRPRRRTRCGPWPTPCWATTPSATRIPAGRCPWALTATRWSIWSCGQSNSARRSAACRTRPIAIEEARHGKELEPDSVRHQPAQHPV